MEHRVLTLHEVAAILRISPITVYRHLALRKKGIGNLPLPIDTGIAGAKLRWLASDVDVYSQSQSNTTTPPIHNLGSVQQKRELKAFEERQKIAKDRLAVHAKRSNQKAK